MGMRLLTLAAVVLAGFALVRHTGVNPLDATQQFLQQRQQQLTAYQQQQAQQQQWRHQQQLGADSSSSSSAAEVAPSAVANAPSKRRLIETTAGSYGGYGEYGNGGYGYGYGSGRRHLMQHEPAGDSTTPTIVYYEDEDEDADNVQPIQQEDIVAAGLDHDDGIELQEDTEEDDSLVDQPEQQKAARKLLLSSSRFDWQQLLTPDADIVLPDEVSSTPARSLLSDGSAVGSYGGYGSYGYGYGYDVAGARRHLMEEVASDDAALYNLWLQQFNMNLHH